MLTGQFAPVCGGQVTTRRGELGPKRCQGEIGSGVDPPRRRNLYDATMEHAMQTGATDARLDALGAKIDDLAASIDKRFEQIDKRFEQIDKRFEQVDRRFEGIDGRLDRMQLRVIGGLFAVIAALIVAPHL